MVVVGGVYKCTKCKRWHVRCASGFVVRRDGLIVTNLHTVEAFNKLDAVRVMTEAGRVYPVLAVLAASRLNDLALLKVDAKGQKKKKKKKKKREGGREGGREVRGRCRCRCRCRFVQVCYMCRFVQVWGVVGAAGFGHVQCSAEQRVVQASHLPGQPGRPRRERQPGRPQ